MGSPIPRNKDPLRRRRRRKAQNHRGNVYDVDVVGAGLLNPPGTPIALFQGLNIPGGDAYGGNLVVFWNFDSVLYDGFWLVLRPDRTVCCQTSNFLTLVRPEATLESS